MKKNMIALAVAAAVASPLAAHAAPTVYGQINMAVEQVDSDIVADDSDSGTQVNSRASRIGVKGSEDLGNGLSAVYKAEFEVQIDSGDTLKNRNQYVGLAGGFGTVLMGRHDTPFKMAQAKDFFNDSARGDIGKMAGGMGYGGKGGELRVSNVLAYVSPEFGGIKLVGALVPKEDGGDANSESSLTDWVSVAAMYGSKKKGLYLSAAMDNASDEFTGSDSVQQLRVTAQYAMGGLIANAMYQDFSGDALTAAQEGTTISAGLGYKMGKFMPKAQIMMLDRDDSAVEDATNYGLGMDYKFGKKTTGYVEYVSRENHKGVDGADDSAFSVGLLHKF